MSGQSNHERHLITARIQLTLSLASPHSRCRLDSAKKRHHRRAPCGSRAWTPRTSLTTCVMRRSTTRLARPKASCRASPCMLLHQIQHRFQGKQHRFVQVFVQTEGDPPGRRQGTWRRQLETWFQVKGQVNSLHGTLNRCHAHFTIALGRMTIADREQASCHGDRQVECAARDQLFAVEVAARHAWRHRRVPAGSIRRHAHHTHERAKRERMTVLIMPHERIGIQRPQQIGTLIRTSEALVERVRPAADRGIAVRARPDHVDMDSQCHARLGAANGDRPA